MVGPSQRRSRGPVDDDEFEILEADPDPQPLAKRARLSFPRGTIVKVEVFDFMTYAGKVTITPGPRLNLILGPNGTGKSSLVCALCVGLGGSPKLLGRADTLVEFVRRGCLHCWTEITLSSGDDARHVKIRRDIRLTQRRDEEGNIVREYDSTRSGYKVDGHDAQVKDVKAKVKEFNIQFDNLCQFLPQDRVVEFAKMDDMERLTATEKALGDSTLYDVHQQLIELRKQLKEKEQERVGQARTLGNLKEEHGKQQRDYERFRRREELMRQAELCGHKQKWLRVSEKEAAVESVQRQLAAARRECTAREREAAEDEQPIKDAEARVLKVRTSRDKLSRECGEMMRAMQAHNVEADKRKNDIDDVLEKRKSLQVESTKRKQQLDRLRAAVAQLEQERAAAPDHLPQDKLDHARALEGRMRAELQPQLNDLESEASRLSDEIMNVTASMTQVDKQLEKLNDIKQQRLRRLGQDPRFNRIEQVRSYITQNTAFQGPVLGPVVLEINVTDPQFQGYVEQHCSGMLNAIITTCREDQENIDRWLQQNRITNFIVGACCHAYDTPLQHPLGTAEQFRQYGILGTMDSVIEAPLLIKHALADKHFINKVYIGSTEAAQHADMLFNQHRISTIYTPNNKISSIRSKHNRDVVSCSFENTRPPKHLAGGAAAAGAQDEEERAQALATKQQLTQRRDALRQQEAATKASRQRVEAERRSVHEQLLALQKEQRDLQMMRTKLQADLDVSKRRLASEEAKPDPMSREPELERQIRGLMDQMVKSALQQVSCMRTLWAKNQELGALELTLKELEMQVHALKRSLEARQAAVIEARRSVAQRTHALDAVKQELQEARVEANQAAPMTSELQQAMQPLPDDIQELSARADSLQAEADAIVCNNPEVMREYTTRQRKIDDLERAVAVLEADVERRSSAIEEKAGAWLPSLRQLVDTINTSFSTNFAEIGCAGEVQLKESEDFDKFAIEIRVKFRNEEELQLLTSNRQSGGERSVSTILYLIALQGVTATPFRVVDEINQGMDPINERKVFIQLVESSCKPGTPQCFMLTPKLLPGLPFTEDITVLNIMNGAHIHEDVLAKCTKGSDLFGNRLHAIAAR